MRKCALGIFLFLFFASCNHKFLNETDIKNYSEICEKTCLEFKGKVKQIKIKDDDYSNTLQLEYKCVCTYKE